MIKIKELFVIKSSYNREITVIELQDFWQNYHLKSILTMFSILDVTCFLFSILAKARSIPRLRTTDGSLFEQSKQQHKQEVVRVIALGTLQPYSNQHSMGNLIVGIPRLLTLDNMYQCLKPRFKTMRLVQSWGHFHGFSLPKYLARLTRLRPTLYLSICLHTCKIIFSFQESI